MSTITIKPLEWSKPRERVCGNLGDYTEWEACFQGQRMCWIACYDASPNAYYLTPIWDRFNRRIPYELSSLAMAQGAANSAWEAFIREAIQ